MKRLLLLGFAICAFAFAPTLPASAMPVAKQQPIVASSDSDVVQVRGHRGGRGHHTTAGAGAGDTIAAIAKSPHRSQRRPPRLAASLITMAAAHL